MELSAHVDIAAEVTWTVTRSAPDRWMAVCDTMGVATEGGTLDEVHGLVPETMGLLLDELFADGELGPYLAARGWSTRDPLPVTTCDVRFTLPWRTVVEGVRTGRGPGSASH